MLSSSITIDAWVLPDVTTGSLRPIVTKYNASLPAPTAASWSFLGTSGGRLAFVVYQLVTVYRSIETTTATLTPGVWQHVAAAFDGATQGMQIYINGAEMPVRLDQNSSTVMMADSIAPVNIGALTLPQGTLNGTWNGVIDEVDVFSRALSAAEVQAIYQAGNDGKCQPLQGGDGAAQTQRIYLPIVIRGG